VGLPAKRALGWLTRRWWTESSSARRYRHRRFMMHAPVGGLVGVMFGILAGPKWGLSPIWTPIVTGALSVYAVHLTMQAESFFRSHMFTRAGRSARVIAIAADILLGGVLGQALAVAMGHDSAVLFGGGAATLVAYNYFGTRFFGGDWVDDIVKALSGQTGSHREKVYAFPRQLAAHGHIDEAVYAYENLSKERIEHAGALVLAAELLAENGRAADAIEWYRKALKAPRVEARRASIFVEKMVELAVGELNDPELVRGDLLELIEHFPDSGEVGWASTMLSMLPSETGEDRWTGIEPGDRDE
jgi:hypothetical protein